MRLTSWNLLHAMGIPPKNPWEESDLGAALAALDSDVLALQEVDHFLPRSRSRDQISDGAMAIGASDWAFAPSVVGTPGEKWRKLSKSDPEIVIQSNSTERFGAYGIGIISKVPVLQWHRLNLGNSPVGMPLLVPGDETGRGKVRAIYVRDEPRVALAAVLSNGWTVINTHLSFVPGFNISQLRRLKKWGLGLGEKTNTRVLIVGDLNLPKNIPIVASTWSSLITQNSYPSWGAKIQFDYILADKIEGRNFRALDTVQTGISDHLPIRVEIDT
jgi:endonuclease/exonuclease/phosphatase family metal-dependent hydrolase